MTWVSEFCCNRSMFYSASFGLNITTFLLKIVNMNQSSQQAILVLFSFLFNRELGSKKVRQVKKKKIYNGKLDLCQNPLHQNIVCLKVFSLLRESLTYFTCRDRTSPFEEKKKKKVFIHVFVQCWNSLSCFSNLTLIYILLYLIRRNSLETKKNNFSRKSISKNSRH